MIDRNQINLILQVIESMNGAVVKMEEAYKDKNAESFEHAKKEILQFQKRLSEELTKSLIKTEDLK